MVFQLSALASTTVDTCVSGVVHQNVELAKVLHGALNEGGDAACCSTYVSTNTAWPPLASISAATRWPRSTSRSARATCAFSDETPHGGLTNPDAPPVTAATLPLSCPIDPILRCVIPDLVRTLALLARRWSAIILASIGKSNSLFPPPARPLTPRVEQPHFCQRNAIPLWCVGPTRHGHTPRAACIFPPVGSGFWEGVTKAHTLWHFEAGQPRRTPRLQLLRRGLGARP